MSTLRGFKQVRRVTQRAVDRLRREVTPYTPEERERRDNIDQLHVHLGAIRARYLPDMESFGQALTELQRTAVVAPGTIPEPPPRIGPLPLTTEQEATLTAYAEEIGTSAEALRQSLHDRLQLRILRDFYLGANGVEAASTALAADMPLVATARVVTTPKMEGPDGR